MSNGGTLLDLCTSATANCAKQCLHMRNALQAVPLTPFRTIQAGPFFDRVFLPICRCICLQKANKYSHNYKYDRLCPQLWLEVTVTGGVYVHVRAEKGIELCKHAPRNVKIQIHLYIYVYI